jgi:hypothetical protein
MELAMDNEAILPSSVPYHSQKLYHSSLLWFKIITSTIQASISNTTHSNNVGSTTVTRAWLTGKGSRLMTVLPH